MDVLVHVLFNVAGFTSLAVKGVCFFRFCCTEHTKPAPKMEVVHVSLPVHRIACVIPFPETNVENVDQQRGYSDKYVSWVSASSFKKIQGYEGQQRLYRSLSEKNVRMNLCLIMTAYLDSSFWICRSLLFPLNFCLWGWIESEVYVTNIDTPYELLARVLDAANRINKCEDKH